MRCFVTLWSYQANDDHSEPVLLYMETGIYPHADSCWECFQPPLFYKFHATLARATGSVDAYDVHRQMQWVNLLFSLLWVWVFLSFVRKIPLKTNVAMVTSCFVLWNPRLASLSVQATNDSIVILLGAAFTLFAWLWLNHGQHKYAALFILSAGVASILKGNGIVLILTAVPILLLAIGMHPGKSILKLSALLLFVGIGSALLGGYYSKYEQFGTPFHINQEKAEPPPFSQDQEWFGKRAGIRSIRSGYLTFPFRALLDTPYQINDEPEFPVHRTNFWTLLYGNFYRVQFHNHPGSWRVLEASWSHDLARVIFVLGLLPTLLLIWGFVMSLVQVLRRKEGWREHALHLLLAGVFLVFVLKYSYDYRDFGNIKPLFLFPAMLSYFFLFAKCVDTIAQKRERRANWLLIPIAVISSLFIADHIALLIQLHEHYFRF